MSEVGTSIMMASVAGLLLAGSSAHAQNWSWDAGGSANNKYEIAANWTFGLSSPTFPDNTVPVSQGDNTLAVEANGAYTIDFDATTGTQTIDSFSFGGGTVFNLSGGAFDKTRPGNSIRDTVGLSGTGNVFNHTGGANSIGHLLRIGVGAGQGTYNLSGGYLNISRGGNTLMGAPRGPSLTVGQSDSVSSIIISGGTLDTRVGVEIGPNATFKVLGGGANITIGGTGSNTDDGHWYQQGTLSVGIGLDGVSKILVTAENGTDQFVIFTNSALLDVDYYNGGYGGGTWTVLELVNGAIPTNGLAFAPDVDTNIWSFAVNNSGVNGKLTVTATGDPAPVQPDVTLTVGATRKQMMRYGLDYERLWFWNSTAVANSVEIANWSVNDCNIDYIRCAMNSEYELNEGSFNLSAYTDKIIPMMTAMRNANPHIKWFASPRPLNEAVSGAAWQPYPLWVTGATNYTSTSFNFNDLKCAEYMLRYLLLMKSYGFKITYMDMSNEWQSDVAGGRVTQADVRDIAQAFQDYLANPWSHPDIPGLVLTADDIPLIVAPSAWNYQQGAAWIDSLNTQAKKDAVDIASCHNTDKTGTAQDFADAVAAYCNPGTEVWETEQHGWKSTSGANEVTTFSFYMESIRAGFTGINGWLAIGQPNQGHAYLINQNGTVTRNVKYHIFKKLSTTSNYGYALDLNEPGQLNNTVALISENLLTVWVNNTSSSAVLTDINFSNYVRDASDITYTRWNESLAVEGVEDTPSSSSSSNVIVNVEGESLYCIEIPLVDPENNFPFVQAETYDAGTGVSILPCSDTGGGDMVAFASEGNEASYGLDITKTYNHDVSFRVASASANIAFDIYDGTNLLGSVDRIATGGAQKWTTLYTSLALDGGPMDLRIVATGGGWNLNWIKFDQEFHLDVGSLDNLALGQTYDASNVYQNNPTYGADKAFDGDLGTRWATDTQPVWLEVDFGTPTAINGVIFHEYGNRTTAYEIQYYDGTWKTAFVGADPDDGQIYSFPTATGTKFRYQSISTTGGSPTIYELEFYNNPYYTDSGPTVAIVTKEAECITLSWSGVEGSTYSLQRSTNLVHGFTTIESGIPVHEATNFNIVLTPDDAAFYRVLLED